MDVEEEEDDDDDDDDVEGGEGVGEEDRSQDQEAHFVGPSAQSKCTWTFEKRPLFCLVIYWKKCRAPIPGTSLRAILRSRNAYGHLR